MEELQNLTGEEIRERLNRHGLKATPQRVLVYEAMCRLGHASADSVYRHLGGPGSPLTIATVYNVLESMTEAGLLALRPSFKGKMFFDVNTDSHFHIYRKDTGTVSDFRDEKLLEAVGEGIRGNLPEGLVLDGVEIQIICHEPNNES